MCLHREPVEGRILVEAQAETILRMSETLESSELTRDQSVAVIESVELAMKTFSVTPEMLDDRLAKQSQELSQEWNKRFDETQELVRSHTSQIWILTFSNDSHTVCTSVWEESPSVSF